MNGSPVKFSKADSYEVSFHFGSEEPASVVTTLWSDRAGLDVEVYDDGIPVVSFSLPWEAVHALQAALALSQVPVN